LSSFVPVGLWQGDDRPLDEPVAAVAAGACVVVAIVVHAVVERATRRTLRSSLTVAAGIGVVGVTSSACATDDAPAPRAAAAVAEHGSEVVLATEVVDAGPDPAHAVVPPMSPAPPRMSVKPAAAPRRVLVIGASSIANALGRAFLRALGTYEGIEVLRVGKSSSSLARPEFFDWPRTLDELCAQFHPDLVIANFGGNCGQQLGGGRDRGIAFKDPRWADAYGRRVTELVEIAHAWGADMLFVGMPNPEVPGYRWQMTRVNAAQRRAAVDAGAAWMSSWEYTSNHDGSVRLLVKNAQGVEAPMRISDGMHLSFAGADHVVEQLLPHIEQLWHLTPRDRALAAAEPVTVDVEGASHAMIALEPRARGRRPSVLLAAPAAWSGASLPLRDLQRLAQREAVGLFVTRDELAGSADAGPRWQALRTRFPVDERVFVLGLDAYDPGAPLAKHTPVAFADVVSLIAFHAARMRAPDDVAPAYAAASVAARHLLERRD
jgi:hypothetical protein